MKYIEVKKFGGAEELKLFDGPDLTPQDGHLLVDIKAAGINFADLMARTGVYPNVPSAPYRPGFELAGIVTQVGAGVTGFAPGDAVVSLSPTGGGYASQANVPAAIALKLPKGFDFGVATGLLVQAMTAYFMLEKANVKEGETVLVSAAAGGVGSMATRIAKIRGAKVIGLASKGKHEQALKNGAVAAVDYNQPGWSKKVLEAAGGKGIDIYLDAEGNFGGEALDVIARLGRWVVYGILNGQLAPLPVERQWEYIFKNITLRGYTIDTDFGNLARAMPDLLEWYEQGKLPVDVTRFPLAKAAEAHEAIAARKTTGKVVLEP